MKRPIKFRGRLWDTGEFVFGNFVTDDQEYLIKFDADSFTCPARIFKIQKNSVVQLVGYDVDGNEVYEGDTVTITRSTQTYKVGTEFTARRGAYVVDDIRSIMHFISGDFKLKEDTK